MAKFSFSMAVLYSVCRLAWQNCLNSIAAFAAKKAFYNAAYVGAKLAEITAAEQMPDEQARNESHETLRIQLKQKATTCREYWKYLERYIVSAYVKGEQKSELDAAGKVQYDDAGEDNWDVIALMMSNAYQFIVDNSGVLEINIETGLPENMPVGFILEFEGVKTAFDTGYTAFLQAEERAQTGTQTKNEANDVIYDKMMLMLGDGQVYLKNSAALKKQFVLANLLELVGTPTGGAEILEGAVTGGQILNVVNSDNKKWVAGVKVRIKNTTTLPVIGGLYFYPANTATEGYNGQGSLLMPGQEEIHTIMATEFKAFLNIQNQGPNEQTYEIELM